MSPKPIDKRNPLETRDAVWASIRKLRTFTLGDLYGETRCGKEMIREYLTGLQAAGYITRASHDNGPFMFTLVKDGGVDAPRVRRDGTEVTQGRSRENMWRTIRIITEFSPRELAIHASTEETVVAEEDAKDYISYLHKAGYLALVAAGKPGHKKGTGTQARYRFLRSKFTGPKPPMVQRVKQVYDPNLGKVVWSDSGLGTRDSGLGKAVADPGSRIPVPGHPGGGK